MCISLVIQHATRMRHIAICGLPALHVFPDYLIKDTIFDKKIEQKCVFWFSLPFVLKHFPFEEEINEIWSKMYIDLHVKYPLFLSNFTHAWIFSTDFRRILKCQVSWKFFQWEPSCSMRTDRRKDSHDEAHSRFSQFCESVWKEWGSVLLPDVSTFWGNCPR